MALSETAVRNAKSTAKIQKLFDGRGLYLEVPISGNKRWRLKYRFHGKEKLLSLGLYPGIKLKEARAKRDEFKTLLANGIDPSATRKAEKDAISDKASNTFEMIAREWHSKHSLQLTEKHAGRIIKDIERDLFPWIGSTPIADLKAPDILKCLRKIEERGKHETAHRRLQNCGQIFRYAIATGRIEQNIIAALKGALSPVKAKHLPSITDPKKVGELLRTIETYRGTPAVEYALKFAPLVFVRPGELRSAKWEGIDLKNKEWRYLVTKTNTDHVVPLSDQAIAILKELKNVTGSSPFLFPSSRSIYRPMSDNAILAAMRRLEIPKDEMCGHGFRAMARTILDEVLEYPIHIIEQQLAHSVRDPNGRAYNRTAHLPQRKEMMQAWANYLDNLKDQKGKLLHYKSVGA